MEAWTIAYGNLAKLLIDLEAAEYAKQPWRWFKDFKVTRIVQECKDVKSVYFTPVDKDLLPLPKPERGQYLCFRWKLPGEEFEISREYSVSEFPKENEYRISVRHVPGGKISGYIHNNLKVGDILKVAPPAGNFVYDPATDKELIFVAGGIGITPLLSMIERALEEGKMSNFCTQTDLLKLEPSVTFSKNTRANLETNSKLLNTFLKTITLMTRLLLIKHSTVN